MESAESDTCLLSSLYQRNKDIQIEHVCGQSTIFPAKNTRLFFSDEWDSWGYK